MQPMQPMQPMQMGNMQMNNQPMEMRLGNMQMRMGEIGQPDSSVRVTPPVPTTQPGQAIRKFCSQCGVAVAASDRFCASCGHQLG
jgi:hypothetical protein